MVFGLNLNLSELGTPTHLPTYLPYRTKWFSIFAITIAHMPFRFWGDHVETATGSYGLDQTEFYLDKLGRF